jgi:hypothetical protein
MRSHRQQLRIPSQLRWMRKIRIPSKRMKIRGKGDIVENTPLSVKDPPNVKPRTHARPTAPPPILKRSKTVPVRPRLAESYHSLFHPRRESFLYEDQDDDDKTADEEYSNEEEGYDAEEKPAPVARTPAKARAIGFVTPIRQSALGRNSLRPISAGDRYARAELTHFIFV